jgi:hypothetical protein
MGMKNHVHKDRMCLIKIDGFHTILGKRKGRIRQNIFNRRNHITNGLDLDGFDGQYIILLVHRYRGSCAFVFMF